MRGVVVFLAFCRSMRCMKGKKKELEVDLGNSGFILK